MRESPSVRLVRCALAALALIAAGCGSGGEGARELTVCSGAGLIKPVEELRAAFERERGARVAVNYAGAGELMAQIAVDRRCDVFLPGADKYVEDADSKGWIAEGTIRDLVLHVPAIAVPRDNPARIRGPADLARPGVRIAVGDAAACAIGRVARAIFERGGVSDEALANVVVTAPTVNQLLIYVALREVDAAIVWQDMAAWSERQDKLSIVEIPREQNVIKTISTAVAAHSRRRELAREFNAFLASPTGRGVWERWGFEPCSD
jgi:molybdate transport system substrate-binding protein